MSLLLKFAGTGILFLITIISGVLLHGRGRPLHSLWLNVHKLTGLVAVILFAVLFYQQIKQLSVSSQVIALLVLGGISMIGIFVSGGVMSIATESSKAMLLIHNSSTVLAILSLSASVFILLSNN